LSRIFFICLVITASHENSITWDEERLEETTALLEVVGENNWRSLIFWGTWKCWHAYVCISTHTQAQICVWKNQCFRSIPWSLWGWNVCV